MAQAQQTMPVIGFLNVLSPEAFAVYVSAFKQGLRQVGYVEGQNLSIEYRWARGSYPRVMTASETEAFVREQQQLWKPAMERIASQTN